jgi:DNA repair protein RecO (recombination protein O)
MATFKVKAIILKRINFYEADRLITAFSEFKGKLIFIAKGIKKPLSKMAGHLELFNLVDLVLAEGRNFDLATQVEATKTFPKLRSNLKKMALAFYFAELVDQLTPEQQPHPKIFQLMNLILTRLDSQEDKLSQDTLLPYFVFNLLKDLGYLPELFQCVSCSKKLEESQNNYFSCQLGGVLDEQCHFKDHLSLKISPNIIKILRIIITRELEFWLKIKLTKEEEINLKKISEQYLHYILEFKF